MAQSVINSLEKMLDFCTQKQKIISKNIANIGTKNYQREDIQFKDVLANSTLPELKTTEVKHIQTLNGSPEGPGYEITHDSSADLVSGINNVDIDKEMTEMAENTLKFKFAARKISDYYKNLDRVIRGGGAA